MRLFPHVKAGDGPTDDHARQEFTVPPIASLVLDSVPGQAGGTASGVLNTFRQMGGSLGVAIFGAVVNASSAFESRLRVSYATTAVLVAIAAASTLALRKPAR